MFGDLEGLRHIENLPTDGFCVTVIIRQRRAAAFTGARIMIDDMVRAFGPLQSGYLVAGRRLSDLRRRLRVRFSRGTLFFFRPSLAGGLELVELSSAALRSSAATRSRKWMFSCSSASTSLISAAAQQSLTPFPDRRLSWRRRVH